MRREEGAEAGVEVNPRAETGQLLGLGGGSGQEGREVRSGETKSLSAGSQVGDASRHVELHTPSAAQEPRVQDEVAYGCP